MTGANAIHCVEKPTSKEQEAQATAAENAATEPLPPYSSVTLQPAQLSQGFSSVVFNPPAAVPVETSAPVEKAPRDYLYLAIFSTIFCFFPVGMFAIVKARDVHKKFSQGDGKSARRASRRAKYLSIAAIIIGILIFTIIAAAVGSYEAHKDDGEVNDDHPFSGFINDDN